MDVKKASVFDLVHYVVDVGEGNGGAAPASADSAAFSLRRGRAHVLGAMNHDAPFEGVIVHVSLEPVQGEGGSVLPGVFSAGEKEAFGALEGIDLIGEGYRIGVSGVLSVGDEVLRDVPGLQVDDEHPLRMGGLRVVDDGEVLPVLDLGPVGVEELHGVAERRPVRYLRLDSRDFEVLQ